MPASDRWSRDDKFKLSLSSVPPLDPIGDIDVTDNGNEPKPTELAKTLVNVPDPFWPRALGLDPRRELEFLRALSERDPILCLLHVPAEAQVQGWIQGTWEGITGWAFRAAQRFIQRIDNSTSDIQVRVGPAALLHTYLKPPVLDADAPKLKDEPQVSISSQSSERWSFQPTLRAYARCGPVRSLNSSPTTKGNQLPNPVDKPMPLFGCRHGSG